MREAVRAAESAGTTVREIAEAVVSSAAELAESVAESGREVAEAGVQRVRSVAERASSTARDLGVQARRILQMLEHVSDEASDLPRVRERFIEAIKILATQLDAHADAYVIGYLGEGGIALQRVSGVEILYLRGGPGPARLRVSRIEGRGARLSAGAAKSAYAGCFYGARELLAQPLTRRGGDVGVAVAAFHFLRATAANASEAAGGWLVALSAGINVGIPIISDLGAFELAETTIADHPLTPEDTAEIEAALSPAPDRGWRRGLAQSLTR